MDKEKLDFLIQELEKQYIPTNNVKEEFFSRFFPNIKEDIEDYIVIFPADYRNITKGFMVPEWVVIDEYTDEIFAFKRDFMRIPKINWGENK